MPYLAETYTENQFGGVNHDRNKSVLLLGCAGYIGSFDTLSEETTDGLPDSGTTQGIISSATENTITSAGANFYTEGNGLKNLFIAIVGGGGEGQVRRILENTSDTITVSKDWDITPTIYGQYKIGAIRFRWETLALESPQNNYLIPRKIKIGCESSLASPEPYDISIYSSGLSSYKLPEIETAKQIITASNWGFPFYRLPQCSRTRRFKVRITGSVNTSHFTVYNIELEFLEAQK